MNRIIFFIIFFGIYFLGNYYFFIRGWQAIPYQRVTAIVYSILFWFSSISFIIARSTGNTSLYGLNSATTWIGSFWLAMALYFLIIVVAIDIVRLFNYFFHFLPVIGSADYNKLKLYTFISAVSVVFLLLIAGNINARNPKKTFLEIEINKPVEKYNNLRLVLVSDIHLGTLVNSKYIKRLTNIINSQNPEIILFAGDILDEQLSPVIRKDIGSPLRQLHAPLGVWAVPGNHEYIGNFKKAAEYIKTLNINLLLDSVVLIDSSFYLVGRNENEAGRFNGKERKSILDLIQHIDNQKPIILLDHQPSHLAEAVASSIDLQLSGHTHDGQIIPFNLIVNKLFELSYGYLQKESTHFYVTSGFGTWGPPVRIGNRPEIVIIDLQFKK